MVELPPTFSEFLQSLNGRGVEYLLIGGYAVAAHGFTRYTRDMDVWVRRSPENAARIMAALGDFGFGAADLSPDLFLDPGKMAQLGREPLRIDILNDAAGVEFDAAAADAVVVTLENVAVPVISLADLRANKAASGRPKDLADLDNLPVP